MNLLGHPSRLFFLTYVSCLFNIFLALTRTVTYRAEVTSTGFVGIDPAAARQLASNVAAWGGDVDYIVSLINQAETLSDVLSNAALPLYEIASYGRSIAHAVTSAADQIEGYTLTIDTPFTLLPLAPRLDLGFEPGIGLGNTPRALRGEAGLQAGTDAAQRGLAGVPIGPVRAVDATTGELEEVRQLWDRSDWLVATANDIPDYWDYARSGMAEEATGLRQQAWNQVAAMGGNPALVIGALVHGQATSREIAYTLELQRAQALHTTAENLTTPRLALERDQIRHDATAILHSLFPTAAYHEVINRFGISLTPYETAALVHHADKALDDGAAVFESSDPIRVLQIMGQGYTEAAAITLVNSAPSSGLGSLTILELEAQLAYVEANHGENTSEFDATLAELNERTHLISGDIYVRADLDAVRAAEAFDVSYGDALAAVITGRIDNTSTHPGAQAALAPALQADLERLVEARNRETVGTGPEMLPMDPARQDELASLPDPSSEATRLLAILGTGSTLALAEALSGAMPVNASPADAARITRQINSLTDRGEDLDTAAGATIAAFERNVDLAVVTTLAADENIDLTSAFNLVVNAEIRAMTVDEYHAYEGFTDQAIFDTIDNIQGGDADGRVSLTDIDYTIANADRLGLDAEVVAAAHAFRNSSNLMVRLDSARDFSGNVVAHESFGRDRFDDVTWSRADIDAFELKQNINFVLAGTVDLIDTMGEGGSLDGHLSKGDFQTVLDNAEELELSGAEIAALTTAINGRLYDQNWLERNRDSIALAAAVVAGTAIFIGSGGLGAGISVGLVAASTGGAAIAAGTTTAAINAFTQEDFDDGVALNTVKGGVIGGLAAPGLAIGGATWATASVGARAGIATGLTGEAAGLIGHGALDWAIDNPFNDVDALDLANIRADYSNRNLLLNADSIAGFVTQVGTNHVIGSLNDKAEAQSPSIANGGLEIPDEYMGIEPASPELLEAVAQRRSVVIAAEGSDDLAFLDALGAEASVGGPLNNHILLRPDASSAAVLDAFLQGPEA